MAHRLHKDDTYDNCLSIEVPIDGVFKNYVFWTEPYLTNEVEDWINNNIKGGYAFHFHSATTAMFYFTQEESLILFKLRFG